LQARGARSRHEALADIALQATPSRTILPFLLQQGLRLGSGGGPLTAIEEDANSHVRLRLQLREPFHDPVAPLGVRPLTGLQVAERKDGVDEDVADHLPSEGLLQEGGGTLQAVMVMPEIIGRHREDAEDLMQVGQVHHHREDAVLTMQQHGQLGESDRREVMGAHAQVLHRRPYRVQSAFVLEEAVFALQERDVRVQGLDLQESALAEQQRLDLLDRRSVSSDQAQGQRSGHLFECIRIDPVTEAARKLPPEDGLAVAGGAGDAGFYLVGPALQPFGEQFPQPSGRGPQPLPYQFPFAGDPAEVAHPAQVGVLHDPGYPSGKLQDGDAARRIGVVLPDDVQDDIAIVGVSVMAVPLPVGRPDMQLHRATPAGGTDADPGIQEVRPLVAVQHAWGKHLYRLQIGGLQGRPVEVLALPDEMQEGFVHGMEVAPTG